MVKCMDGWVRTTILPHVGALLNCLCLSLLICKEEVILLPPIS